MSVRNYHYSLCNNPELCGSQSADVCKKEVPSNYFSAQFSQISAGKNGKRLLALVAAFSGNLLASSQQSSFQTHASDRQSLDMDAIHFSKRSCII
jgi:hypothetical protein